MTDFASLKAKYPDLIPERMAFECGIGWEQVLDRYFAMVALAMTSATRLRLERVYEKHGSLRVDAMAEGAVTADIRLALDKAEILADSRSYRYCETCGARGSLRSKHRLFIACEAHAEGARPLPPDEGRVRLKGVNYQYDELLDDLVVIERQHEEATE